MLRYLPRGYTKGRLCSFGITEAIVGGLVALGVGADAAGIVAPALVGIGTGAAAGAGLGAITGGNVGLDALGGALTGGLIGGAGPILGGALGIGTVGGDVLAGTAGGALSSTITGANPLTSAVEGGLSGGVSGLLTPGGAAGGAATAPGASAVSAAAPVGTPGPDLASLVATGGAGGGLPGLAPGTSGGGAAIPGVGPSAGGLASTPQAAIAPGGDLSNLAAASGSAPGSDLSALTGTGTGAGTGGPGALSALLGSGGGGGLLSPGSGGSDFATGAPGGGSVGGAPGAAGSGGGGIGQSILASVEKNPAGVALAGGGLLLSLLNNQQFPNAAGNAKTLQAEAGQFGAQGAQLQSYLQSGQLPPGAAIAIQNATAAAKAKIRSDYAGRGMTGSSSETTDLNQIDLNAAAQSFQIADQLLQQGISESQLSAQLYADLISLDLQQSARTGQAIAGFASALGGGGGGGNSITLKAA